MLNALALENIGHSFKKLRQYDSARLYYNKFHHYTNKELKTHPIRTRFYSDMAGLEYELKHYSKALCLIDSALQIQNQEEELEGPASSNATGGLIYLAMGENLKAVNSYHTSLNLETNGPKLENIYSHPSLQNHARAAIYLDHYSSKAYAFSKLYTQTHKLVDLKFSLGTYQKCDTLVDMLRQSHLNYRDKIQLNKTARNTYEGAISVALQLFEITHLKQYLDQAFYFCERSKARALADGMADGVAKGFSRIPDHILSLEKDLKRKLSFYQSQIDNEKSKGKESDSSSIATFETELFHAQLSHDSLIKSLEKSFPEYYQLKYKNNILSIRQVQKHLDNKTAMLEYFVGDSATYVFSITNTSFDYTTLPAAVHLNDNITKLRAALNPQRVGKEPEAVYQDFTQHAYQLFDEHVKLPLTKVNANHTLSRLIIIPDGQLGYIPFDVLLSKPVSNQTISYKSLSYLLNDYSISYAYSASLLFDHHSVVDHKNNLLAFAPSYAVHASSDSVRSFQLGRFRDHVTALRFNQAEVNAISRFIPGSVFTGASAVEREFKEMAADYSIVHLAMHALVDDEEPMRSKLVFTDVADSLEDGYLNVYELYNMELPIDMVVLSACETGYGKLEKGEGIMSMARAFSYAGCPSVVMSHWLADDETTAKLMELFYQHLADGMSKDEALRQAKLDLIQEGDPAHINPALWAGFVVLGNTEPIVNPFNWSWVIYSVVGLGALLGGVVYFKNRKRKPEC